MTIKEPDFNSLYIDGGVPTETGTPVPDAVIPTPDTAPVDGTTAPTEADKSIDEVAAIAAQDTTPPADGALPTDVPIDVPTDVPTDIVPEPNGELPGEEVSTDGPNGDELQKMLDALGEDTQSGAETTQEIKTAAEEIKKSVDENDTESQKMIDGLLTKIAELEAKDLKSSKTIEILSGEYDKAIGDKLSLEYGNANDSKLISMINETPELKDIISANMLVQKGKEGAKDSLIQAYKTALENLTGQTFDSVIAAKKVDEVSALSAGQDVGTETPIATGDNIYVA